MYSTLKINVGYIEAHIFPGLSNSKSTGATSGAETTLPILNWVRGALSLLSLCSVLWIIVCPFSFVHCIVYPF